MKNSTTVERKSERELVVTRTFNAPARLVWTNDESDDGAVAGMEGGRERGTVMKSIY